MSDCSPGASTHGRKLSASCRISIELGYFAVKSLVSGLVRCNLDRLLSRQDPIQAELKVRSEFIRKAHLYLGGVREPETFLEGLALIQHHGGPTRLIDFTRAPLMAAFFALEKESEATHCAVWAIDEIACHRRAVARIRMIDSDFSWLQEQHNIEEAINARLGSSPPQRFVAPIQPSRLNARMAIQHGIFLCLGDPGSDLFENLIPGEPNEPPIRVVKIEFPRMERGRALEGLRLLNIGRESLFPGLDGLAQSLGQLLVPVNHALDALEEVLMRPQDWPGATP